jgi:hypothetical protein
MSGVRQYFTPVVGTEVTTPSMGHFNVFPIPADGRAIDQGASNWMRLREEIVGTATEPVIVLTTAGICTTASGRSVVRGTCDGDR